MDLGLAGVISGAGEAGSKALTLAQAQYGAEKLQNSRDDMDNLRQRRLIEHQEKMQGAQITAAHTENEANRTVTKEEGAATRTAAAENTDKTIQSHEHVAMESNVSHEKISGDQQKNALEIAKLNNTMHENVAKLQRDMQTKQFDKTFTAAKMTATTSALKDLSDQMIHLNIAVSNPLADKTSPEYKSAVEILQKAQRLHMVYSQQLAEMIGAPPGGAPANPQFPKDVSGAMPTPGLPPFVPPPIGQAPGLAQTPPPIQGRPY